MEKKFDKIYYRIINEGPLGSAVQGIGAALKNNVGEILGGIDPTKSALPSVTKAVGQIPGAIGSLKPKWGTPLDIEKHKKDPSSFVGTTIFKKPRDTNEIITATVADVSNLRNQGYFTATLSDPNYIVIVPKRQQTNMPDQNKIPEYVIRKDRFNNYIKQFTQKSTNTFTVDSGESKSWVYGQLY
jgi:hypothetical protein